MKFKFYVPLIMLGCYLCFQNIYGNNSSDEYLSAMETYKDKELKKSINYLEGLNVKVDSVGVSALVIPVFQVVSPIDSIYNYGLLSKKILIPDSLETEVLYFDNDSIIAQITYGGRRRVYLYKEIELSQIEKYALSISDTLFYVRILGINVNCFLCIYKNETIIYINLETKKEYNNIAEALISMYGTLENYEKSRTYYLNQISE